MSDQGEERENIDPNQISNLFGPRGDGEMMDFELNEEEGYVESRHYPEDTKPEIGPEFASDDEDEKAGFFGSIRTKIIESKEETKEDSGGGFMGSIREKVALARQSKQAELDKTAGLNFNIKTKLSKQTESEPKGIFEQALTPLSSAEISILQAEISADETIFRKIETGKTASHIRQQIGFLVGIAFVVLFYLAQGVHYFDSTLLDLKQPDWTPEILSGEPMAAIMFAIGMVLPVMTIFVIANGVRLLISGIVNLEIDKIAYGLISLALAMVCLFMLWGGDVIGAVIISLIYGAVALIAWVFRI